MSKACNIERIYDLIGHKVDRRCPKCRGQLVANKIGEEWCSTPECDYGCEDVYEELGLYDVIKRREHDPST